MMSELVLAPAPNWYCSGAVSSDAASCIVYAANTSLVLVELSSDNNNACIAEFRGLIHQAHKERINATAIYRQSDELMFLFSAADDGCVKMWQCSCQCSSSDSPKFTVEMARQHNVHSGGGVLSLDISAARPSVVVSVNGEGAGCCVVVWDSQAHTTRRVQLAEVRVSAGDCVLRCSPHSHQLALLSAKHGVIYSISLAGGGRVMHKFSGHEAEVTDIVWCPGINELLSFSDDHLFCSVGRDHTLRVWGSRGGRCHVTHKTRAAGRRAAAVAADRNWQCVSWPRTDSIYYGTAAGQVAALQLSSGAQHSRKQSVESVHSRAVCSLCVARGGAVLVSVGADRLLITHSLSRADETPCPPPSSLTHTTLGGFCYQLASCAQDPGRVAVACGDNLVRVLNMNRDHAASSCLVLRHGIKSKVTAVCWHPCHDNRLACGTELGRVSVFEPLSGKCVQQSERRHSSAVLSVQWRQSEGRCALFSVSAMDGVWLHQQGQTACGWPDNDMLAGRSCVTLRWSEDGSLAVLGCEDGSLVFLDWSTSWQLQCATCRGHVTQLHWHPTCNQAHWNHTLAVASSTGRIRLFRAHPLLSEDGRNQSLQPFIQLDAHKAAVSDISWSPHCVGQLASCSLDKTTRVWDVQRGQCIAVFTSTWRGVRCCLWHPLHQHLVLSAAEDCTLSVHNLLSPDSPPPLLCTTDTGVKSQPACSQSKKKSRSSTNKKVHSNNEADVSAGSRVTAAVAGGDSCQQARDLGDGKRVRTQKCLVPLSVALENRGKKFSQTDIDLLIDQHSSSASGSVTSSHDVITSHLALFCEDQSAFDRFMSSEMSHHQSQRALLQSTQLGMYRGDVSDIIRQAALQSCLNDHLVSLAPMVSYSFWQQMCCSYSKQLEDAGDIVRASCYLVSSHKVQDAVELLLRHRLYREAVVLCRSRLPEHSASVHRALTLWSQQLVSEGNIELAVKCLIFLREFGEASVLLTRRSDLASLRLAVRLATLADDGARARQLLVQCVHESCVRCEWSQALSLCRQMSCQAGYYLCLAHECVVQSLQHTDLSSLVIWTARLLLSDDVTRSRDEAVSDQSGSLVSEIGGVWTRESERDGLDGLAPELRDLDYLTEPTNASQLWLLVACSCYRHLSVGEHSGILAALSPWLHKCRHLCEDKLPALAALLFPSSPHDDVWSCCGDVLVLAVLMVLEKCEPVVSQSAQHIAADGVSCRTAGLAEDNARAVVDDVLDHVLESVHLASSGLHTTHSDSQGQVERGPGESLLDGAVVSADEQHQSSLALNEPTSPETGSVCAEAHVNVSTATTSQKTVRHADLMSGQLWRQCVTSLTALTKSLSLHDQSVLQRVHALSSKCQ